MLRYSMHRVIHYKQTNDLEGFTISVKKPLKKPKDKTSVFSKYTVFI